MIRENYLIKQVDSGLKGKTPYEVRGDTLSYVSS